MNQTDLVNAATQAANTSKNLIGQQVERQAKALGSTLTQTARDLEQVGTHLRSSGTIPRAAEFADWAAGYADRAGTYLSGGNADRFVGDLERLGREQPWAIAASAAALGFIGARIVKSSGARRYAADAYHAPTDR